MPQTVIDFNTSSPPQFQDLPHGLLTPPPHVVERIAQDQAKFPPGVYSDEYAERTMNDWTVHHYFDNPYWYFEVLYRPTPQGPEVLAIGEEEILAYTKDMPPGEQLKLETWMP